MKSGLLRFCVIVCTLLCSIDTVKAQSLTLLVPVLDASHRVLERATPDGARRVPVVLVADADDSRVRAIGHEFSAPFPQTLLGMIQDTAQRFDAAQAPYVLLSVEDGGYARQGFWLRDGEQERYLNHWYVDMVADEGSIRSGQFEEIWAHETAHILLALATGPLPRRSNNMHLSMTLTDSVTAADEGLAIALQPLARELSRNPTLHATDRGIDRRNYARLWLSQIDQDLRHHGVRQNLFVHERVEISSATMLPMRERYRRWETGTLFDRYRLRTGAQLFASEGFMATVLYRLLHDAQGSEHWSATLSGLLEAAHVAAQQDTQRPFGARWLEAYGQLFSEQRETLVQMFLEASFGVSLDPAAHSVYEELASASLTGDMQGLVSSLPKARAYLSTLTQSVVNGERALDSAVAPPLWIVNSELLVGTALWSQTEDRPLHIDLNTAPAVLLETLPGFNGDLAALAVSQRKQAGDFQNFQDFCTRLALSTEDCRAIQALQLADRN